MIKLRNSWMRTLTMDLYHRSKLKTMPMRGLLKNIGDNSLPYGIYVDQWPKFCTVVVRPNSESIPVYRIGIYSENVRVLEDMLCESDFLPAFTAIRAMTVPMELLPAFENTATRLNLNATFLGREDPRNFIVFDIPEPADQEEHIHKVVRNLPPDTYFAPLDLTKDLDTIIANWKTFNWNDFYINDIEGIPATKFYIEKCGPSLGVYRQSDNMLISWLLSDIDTSGIMDYTIPEYRKTPVTNCRKLEWLRQKIEIGECYWGSIAKSNAISWKSFARFGKFVQCYPDVDLFHCVMRPKQDYISRI